jgi:hypothetical protein
MRLLWREVTPHERLQVGGGVRPNLRGCGIGPTVRCFLKENRPKGLAGTGVSSTMSGRIGDRIPRGIKSVPVKPICIDPIFAGSISILRVGGIVRYGLIVAEADGMINQNVETGNRIWHGRRRHFGIQNQRVRRHL